MKKLAFILLLLINLVCITGCNSKTFSFKEVSGFEISNIEKVTYSLGPFQSFREEFQGDYSKFLDVKYKFVGNDEKAINKFNDVRKNYNFSFDVELLNFSEMICFYVYNNKIYFGDNNVGLYESDDNISLIDLKIEAKNR